MGILAITVMSSGCSAEKADIIDCPQRDLSFSVDSPLMDIVNNERARAIANEGLNGVLDRLPESLASGTPPSFSAILSVRSIASMSQIPSDKLDAINASLSAISLSEADKVKRCERYDNDVPTFNLAEGTLNVLVFEKINGFKDEPSFNAAKAMLAKMAYDNNWSLVGTDKAGAFNEDTLADFDVVVWNNVSGDVLTLSQRKAFKQYIENGGAYVGIHGAGGDPIYSWDWYVSELVGAQFIGHPKEPHFQHARLTTEDNKAGVGKGLPAEWFLEEEWYSFKTSPRENSAFIVATLDESTYEPKGYSGESLAMGDHPVAWGKCVKKGRAFYSALGHVPAVYEDKHHKSLIRQAIEWAAKDEAGLCN
ncbi:hypothetical protein AltI4_45290 (plasmid) [Alteromonas sp. I4]|nr:hypothetical protein AltI4_45290 [Alteromonas sp. I4]